MLDSDRSVVKRGVYCNCDGLHSEFVSHSSGAPRLSSEGHSDGVNLFPTRQRHFEADELPEVLVAVVMSSPAKCCHSECENSMLQCAEAC